MDDLKGKLKTLLAKTHNAARGAGGSGFSGPGRRLGTAEEAGVPQPRVQGAAHAAAGSSSGQAAQQPRARPRPPPSSAAAQASQPLQPATEFTPFTAVVGSGAARTAAPSSSADAPPRRPPPAAAGPAPGAAAPAQPVSADVVEELQAGLGLILSQPDVAPGTLAVLGKLLSNLAGSPQEAKFRQLRLGNPKLAASVVAVPGGLEFLSAAGFEVHHEPSNPGEGFAAFLDDGKLPCVHAALAQLQAQQAQLQAQQAQLQAQHQAQQAAPASSPAAAAAAAGAAAAGSSSASRAAPPAAAPPVPAVDRATAVLLPATPDASAPPDWFFERTAAELKAEYASLVRRRQMGELIASKAWKDAQLGRSAAAAAVITLRVRFPEGVCLQGRFNVREPVQRVHEWLSAALRWPLTYELVGPGGRKPLPAAGTVGDACSGDAVLCFRALEASRQGYLVDGAGRELPFLRDELLARAAAH